MTVLSPWTAPPQWTVPRGAPPRVDTKPNDNNRVFCGSPSHLLTHIVSLSDALSKEEEEDKRKEVRHNRALLFYIKI